MKTLLLVILNLALAGLFIFLIRRSGLLTYYREGRFWLTFFAVAIITLMDELTSVFYATAEAYRFIGPSAIVFIAFTALFIHYMTTRWSRSLKFSTTTKFTAEVFITFRTLYLAL